MKRIFTLVILLLIKTAENKMQKEQMGFSSSVFAILVVIFAKIYLYSLKSK